MAEQWRVQCERINLLQGTFKIKIFWRLYDNECYSLLLLLCLNLTIVPSVTVHL